MLCQNGEGENIFDQLNFPEAVSLDSSGDTCTRAMMVSWRQEGAAGLVMEQPVLHWQQRTTQGSRAEFSPSEVPSGEASLAVLILQGTREEWCH